MRTNVRSKRTQVFTEEGAPAVAINSLQRLRRSVISCLLFEDQFYVDGIEIAKQIAHDAGNVTIGELAQVAAEARQRFGLRHVPLLLTVELIKRTAGTPQSQIVCSTIEQVISRVDEIAELVTLYWKANPDKMLPHQVRKGLARAFRRFDEYQFAKYGNDKGKPVKLRDVLRLARPKPIDDEQSALFKGIKEGTLAPPDTWEVALTRGEDKGATFARLLRDDRLGYLALLRNLRNMEQSGVDHALVKKAILARKGARWVFPFRYVAAARAAPQFERELDQALMQAVSEMPHLGGKTIVLVDVSGSMDCRMSVKSNMDRIDAAATLASIIPSDDVRVFTFSNQTVEVPARKGMAGVDAIKNSQNHSGTYLGGAVAHANSLPHDRLIVITDEQSHERRNRTGQLL